MAQPIIPWLGGKRRLADTLLARFPSHTCYVEVFAGGAALFFLRPPADVEVLNDVNGELVNLYRVVKVHLEEFVRQFKWALSSREVFKWMQDHAGPQTLTDMRASGAVLLSAAAGLRRPGGRPDVGHGHHHAGHRPSTCSASRKTSALPTCGWPVALTSSSWTGETCITALRQSRTRFFYMDPPYWQTEGYGVPFPWDQYEADGQ